MSPPALRMARRSGLVGVSSFSGRWEQRATAHAVGGTAEPSAAGGRHCAPLRQSRLRPLPASPALNGWLRSSRQVAELSFRRLATMSCGANCCVRQSWPAFADWMPSERATEYLPITTAAMRRAAEVWAQARQRGQPTAGDNTIDADMILVGQAETIGVRFTVATTNVGHLSRFVPADLWQNIAP